MGVLVVRLKSVFGKALGAYATGWGKGIGAEGLSAFNIETFSLWGRTGTTEEITQGTIKGENKAVDSEVKDNQEDCDALPPRKQADTQTGPPEAAWSEVQQADTEVC